MALLPEKKSEKVLTEKQEAFLEHLFSAECKGDVGKAMKAAGYDTSTYKPHQIINALRSEIVERAEEMLAAHSPKATLAIVGLIDEPAQDGAKTKLNAAMTVLDRVGLSKKDKLELSGQGVQGIFILPAKRED